MLKWRRGIKLRQTIDKGIHYHADQMKIAKSYGFDSIEQATRKMYQGGMSLSQIGKVFEIQPASVWVRLKKFGVERRGRGGANRVKQR